jgi:hypothetical protein
MNIDKIKTANLLKEEVEAHFAGVKSIEEWNQRRQDLCDIWATKFTGEFKVVVAGVEAIIPEWVQMIAVYVDASGLSVKLLGKNHIDPESKVGAVLQ